MEYRTLEINLISAKDLNNLNIFSKMDVYAVVSIGGGDPRAKQKTPVDKDGSTSPTWNFPMKFTVDEAALQQNRLTLVVKLKDERVFGDKDIGEVAVPIKELIGDNKKSVESVQFVRYQVRKPSGKPKGELNFSYKFSEKIAGAGAPLTSSKGDEPVTAYPATMAAGPSSAYPPPPAGSYPPPPAGSYPPPAAGGYPQPAYPPPAYPHAAPPAAGYGYPPQPYGGYPPPPQGYGYPPQQGYGYAPQQGYGYPPVQQPPKKNKFGGGGGLGLGAGLLGGAVGGLLLGDMISDAGSYDAGYDAGFDDAGFDF